MTDHEAKAREIVQQRECCREHVCASEALEACIAQALREARREGMEMAAAIADTLEEDAGDLIRAAIRAGKEEK